MELPENETSRSYRALPAVLRVEGEWEGGGIIREIPSPVGVFLFGTLRDVMLWLLLPPQRLDQAFRSGASDLRRKALSRIAAPADLAEHLSVLIQICDGNIKRTEVGTACISVASWANACGAAHTELAYTQAGAVAEPTALAHSLKTAKLARDLAQYPRAETWFRRTIKLSRLAKDRSTYVYAYLGLGALYTRIGNGPAAKAVFERALKSAMRWRLRELAGAAHHDLFHVFADLGDLRRAYDHARNAQINYGGAQHYLTRLAGDIATLWLRVGAGRRAFPIFEAIIPLTPDIGLRAVWSAQLVRCAAVSGLGQSYERVRMLALAAISTSHDPWRRAEAEAILALADLGMGEWDRAASVAESALLLATRLGATEVQMYAERAVADARAHRREGATVDSVEPPGLARIADSLAGSLREAVHP